MGEVNINWGGLVQRTNPFAEFQQGMESGRTRRLDEDRANLFAQEQQYRMEERQRGRAKEDENNLEQGLVSHMARTDPRAAQAKAVEVGQYDMADQIGKLDAQQREVAKERTGILVAYLDSLQGQDEATAKAQIMQDAPALMELGYTQEQIQGFSATPANVARMKAEALGLKGLLEQQNKDRDDKRADDKAKADEAYRAKTLAQGDRRIGLSADANRRGWASFNERKKAGGFGTPGAPGSGMIDPNDVEED